MLKKTLKFIFIFLKLILMIFKYIKKIINNIIFIIFILFIILFIYKNIYKKKFLKQPKCALLLDLKGAISDQVPIINTNKNKNYRFYKTLIKKNKENSIFDIISIIKNAKKDERINGIILKLDGLTDIDQSSLEYIGKTLKDFKKSKKPIFSIGNNYNQIQYYLASFADKIYLSKGGNIKIYGYSTNKLYYKTFLENLKVSSNIIQIGHYKTAVEPFTNNNMSNQSKKMNTYWINFIWNDYLSTISRNRNINPKIIFSTMDNFIRDLNSSYKDEENYAIKKNLVDHVLSSSEIDIELGKIFGWNKRKQTFNAISIYDYRLNKSKINLKKKKQNEPANIAVIIIRGMITNNSNNSNSTNCINIINQIKQALFNQNIKSIILRVNTPGGSLTASELIRNELLEIKKAKKPIIVSMGGIATSGGYWISTPADCIIAHKNTLTGSIGVFGIINTFEKSLNSIGIYCDGVSNTPMADSSIMKGINEKTLEVIKINIQNGYKKFIKCVSEGRNKSIKEVEKIAQGKIWSGSDAFKNGLIDHIGDFDDAIYKAAKLGNIKKPILSWLNSENQIFLDKLINNLKNFLVTNEKDLFLDKIKINFLKEIDFIQNMDDPLNEYVYFQL